MQATQENELPKIVPSTRSLLIRDPAFFKRMIDAGAYVPKLRPADVSRGVLMYVMEVLDVSRNIKLALDFELPAIESANIHTFEQEKWEARKARKEGEVATEMETVPVWDTRNAPSQYRLDLIDALDPWVELLEKSAMGEELEFTPVREFQVLKWPWKDEGHKNLIAFIEHFQPELSLYRIRPGVMIYDPEQKTATYTLQLTQFKGKTALAIAEEKARSKQRRGAKRARTEEHVSSENGDAEAPAIEA